MASTGVDFAVNGASDLVRAGDAANMFGNRRVAGLDEVRSARNTRVNRIEQVLKEQVHPIKEIVEARQRLEVNVERAMQQVEKRRRFRLGGQGWEEEEVVGGELRDEVGERCMDIVRTIAETRKKTS